MSAIELLGMVIAIYLLVFFAGIAVGYKCRNLGERNGDEQV